jgi:hypothetical protein
LYISDLSGSFLSASPFAAWLAAVAINAGSRMHISLLVSAIFASPDELISACLALLVRYAVSCGIVAI